MNETKPEKRLVSKLRSFFRLSRLFGKRLSVSMPRRPVARKQYIENVKKRICIYVESGKWICFGLIGLASSVHNAIIAWNGVYTFVSKGDILVWIETGGLSLIFVWLALRFGVRKTKSIELVQPLTSHNAHLLSAQESLLRGSDIPPTDQQKVLLRAAQAEETAAGELLRATLDANSHDLTARKIAAFLHHYGVQ